MLGPNCFVIITSWLKIKVIFREFIAAPQTIAFFAQFVVLHYYKLFEKTLILQPDVVTSTSVRLVYVEICYKPSVLRLHHLGLLYLCVVRTLSVWIVVLVGVPIRSYRRKRLGNTNHILFISIYLS